MTKNSRKNSISQLRSHILISFPLIRLQRLLLAQELLKGHRQAFGPTLKTPVKTAASHKSELCFPTQAPRSWAPWEAAVMAQSLCPCNPRADLDWWPTQACLSKHSGNKPVDGNAHLSFCPFLTFKRKREGKRGRGGGICICFSESERYIFCSKRNLLECVIL